MPPRLDSIRTPWGLCATFPEAEVPIHLQPRQRNQPPQAAQADQGDTCKGSEPVADRHVEHRELRRPWRLRLARRAIHLLREHGLEGRSVACRAVTSRLRLWDETSPRLARHAWAVIARAARIRSRQSGR